MADVNIIGKKVNTGSVPNLNGILDLAKKISEKRGNNLTIKKMLPKEERPTTSSYDEALNPKQKNVSNLSDYCFRW